MAKLRNKMQAAHEIARQTLQTAQQNMKRGYDLNIRQFEYHVGDLVYVLDTAHKVGRAKKLDPPWKGPGIVIKKLSSYIYTIRLQRTTLTVNHDRIKKCNDRLIADWLLEAKEKVDKGESIEEEDADQIYCLCRKPDDGEFMIQCNYCEDWFHGQCVQLTPELADTIRAFKCPRCQTPQLYPRI